MQAPLALRDIHQPSAPPWWPPAPGWWMLFLLLVLALLAWGWWSRRRRLRRARLAALFDGTVARAGTPAEEVALLSELLRRAARTRDPDADRLQGDDWLAFLDGPGGKRQGPVFSTGAGRLLLEGGWRRNVQPSEVEALRPLARERFLLWMR